MLLVVGYGSGIEAPRCCAMVATTLACAPVSLSLPVMPFTSCDQHLPTPHRTLPPPQSGLDYLEGAPVDYLVSYIVRNQESMSANMRLEVRSVPYR